LWERWCRLGHATKTRDLIATAPNCRHRFVDEHKGSGGSNHLEARPAAAVQADEPDDPAGGKDEGENVPAIVMTPFLHNSRQPPRPLPAPSRFDSSSLWIRKGKSCE
jgi:hypothetical protein